MQSLIMEGNLEHNEQSLLFDLLKVFDPIESAVKNRIFSLKSSILLHLCVISSELPSNISTMPLSLKLVIIVLVLLLKLFFCVTRNTLNNYFGGFIKLPC